MANNIEVVSFNPPIQNESVLMNEKEVEDYLLVFSNPFDIQDYKSADFSDTIPQDEVEDVFLRMFRLNKDDPSLSIFLKQVWVLKDSANEISSKDLAIIAMKAVFKILQEYLGLWIKPYLSADNDQIFIRLKSSDHNLKVQADLIDYILQFNEKNSDINKFDAQLFQMVYPFGPFEKNGGNRSKSVIGQIGGTEELYQRYDKEGNPCENGEIFKFNDRVRIVHSMLLSVFDLGELINFKLLYAHFPLHYSPLLTELQTEWATHKAFFKGQPFDKIRNYFGEGVTLYFAWLQYYVYWLLFPSLFGTAIAIVLFSSGQSNESTLSSVCFFLFSLLLSISSTLMGQLWLRRESSLAWNWGLSDFEHTEEQRTEHKGVFAKDEISGKMKKIYKPHGIEKYASFMGYSVIILFLGIVIAALVAIFTYRDQGNDSLHTILPGIINAVQIKILNFVTII